MSTDLSTWSVHQLLTDENGALLPTVKIEVAAKVLGIGRTSAFAAAREGRIPVLHLGPRRMVVPVPRLIAMLTEDAEPPAPASESRHLKAAG